ncbi:MAG: aldehyde dehydrogenase family protein [Actinobacteria bacterium]|nr:aldehyde dehydrogenase family protein [Actinomycetota bacterium]MCL5445562.1 aldehyde dehydrogenase family protein [Actinomycetota bacterium]
MAAARGSASTNQPARKGASAPSDAVAKSAARLDTGHLDDVVTHLSAHSSIWAATSASARAVLLDRLIHDTMTAASGWLSDACKAKGLHPNSPEAGEELFAGIGTLVRIARLLRDSITDIEQFGRPRYPGPVLAHDDRLAVTVFPVSTYDRILFAKTTAEVWMQPGVTREEIDSRQAWAYRDPQRAKGVSLVLAAGNVASLGPRDVLHKLFVEGKVVVLKSNPVNAYLIPHWTRALRCLIDAGVLRIVDGGADVGEYLTRHPDVDEIHITGSDKTYDAIVFGAGADGARRKAANDPIVTKPVTAELGNVSPVIVVPGNWSNSDLVYQAEHVATMLANNAGFNCLSARVIITMAGWRQRETFFSALAEALSRVPTRRAYYPGALQRRETFISEHPDPVEIGRAGDDTAPWTLIRDVDAGNPDDICFNVEAFCGLFAETALAQDSIPAFIDAAVEFCNNTLWGTLSATVIVDPHTQQDPAVAAAVRRCVANLNYGGIGLNIWHGLVFALGTTTWGAYPGHPATDIQSGSGVVGNAYMFAQPQKSVVTAPFRSRPKPPWFATNQSQLAVMKRLLAFEAKPSLARLPGILRAALKQ